VKVKLNKREEGLLDTYGQEMQQVVICSEYDSNDRGMKRSIKRAEEARKKITSLICRLKNKVKKLRSHIYDFNDAQKERNHVPNALMRDND
jgi:hypothetical protein